MRRDDTLRASPTDPAELADLPAALMTMTMHMVESRIDLMGTLARCGSPTEVSEVMTRWFERRIAEFGEDQARVATAMFSSFTHAASAATEAIETANGLAKTGIEKAGNHSKAA